MNTDTLLPNLRTLVISHDKDADTITTQHVADLSPLGLVLSPSLKCLKIQDLPSSISIDLPMLFHLVVSGGSNIKLIYFESHPQPMLVQSIARCFPSLEHVVVLQNPKQAGPHNQNLSMLDTLQTFTSLVYLQIDLKLFPRVERPPTIIHQRLETLHIHGTPQDCLTFLQTFRLPSGYEFSATIDDPGTALVVWKSFFEVLARSCPGTRFLRLEVASSMARRVKKLRITDLAPVMVFPLEWCKFYAIPSELSTQDMHILLNRWSSLQVLKLPCNSIGNTQGSNNMNTDVVLLTDIAKHPSLQFLMINLDFQSLANSKFSNPVVKPQSQSHLVELEVNLIKNFPSRLRDIHNLAWNLLKSFPLLKVIRYIGENKTAKEQLKEFQELLDVLREEKR
jgi:hypothetical protein